MSPRILVVDDEPSVTDLLAYNLRKSGYEPLAAADGLEALRLAKSAAPDLILLDVMIPGPDGLDVCRELRKTSQVPIIMITARGEEIDRVVGLELGADDYICKPFSVRELMARVKAVLRRAQPGNGEPDSILHGPGGLRLDPADRSAIVGETALDLSRLEFDLLHLLLASPRRVFSREQLIEKIWGYDVTGEARVVDSTVKRLRAKLRAAGSDADVIEAVRGVGYRIQAI